ncbi:rhomboid family intramembrane serine protease [uncultured Flavobacterium sp.]|uniref:rhomboid family intramembrane serine protease n=1 Tax=uncultured Flavobacterium sp. TaxID=165435 RepID=UPI0025D7A8DC|nr:rhomboid family intramembrane serine protease [uncultured Flavobacterium sp.]
MGILDDLKMEYRVGGIVQRLIFWNVGLFVVPMILFSILRLSGTDLPEWDWTHRFAHGQDWFSLSSNPAHLLWKPWSILLYAFLHSGFLHLLFNMLMLHFSGRLFLTFFTQKQLFGVYVLGGIFAGLLYIVSYSLLPALAGTQSGMTGASAAIMAILFAVTAYSPMYSVRMLLIGTVKLWHIAATLLVIDLIYVSVENTGGHIAHLGGALFGYLYILSLKNGTDISKGVSGIIGFFSNLFKPKKSTPFTAVHRNTAPSPRPSARPKDVTQKQIDDILDKISKSGYDSLTSEEKEFLFRLQNK